VFRFANGVKQMSKGLGKVEQTILNRWSAHLYERAGDGFYKNGLSEKVVISLSKLPNTEAGKKSAKRAIKSLIRKGYIMPVEWEEQGYFGSSYLKRGYQLTHKPQDGALYQHWRRNSGFAK